MATYKGIQGFTWQKVSSDPSDAVAGQVWYNSSTGKFKIGTQIASGWASGGNVNTSRKSGAGCGTQTAALFIGGQAPAKLCINRNL